MTTSKPRFALGKLVATPAALALMQEHGIDGLELLSRHVRGDWGDLNEEDKQENEFSVKEGFRILSAYGHGKRRLWVITEADRSVTTILRRKTIKEPSCCRSLWLQRPAAPSDRLCLLY